MAAGRRRCGLVLLHGAELGAWLWDGVTAELSRVSRPTAAVDLPGRGASAADRRDVTLADAVDSVVADVTAWGSGPLVVVAHSFSGVLVPGIAEALGDRLRAVVWVGATVPLQGRAWVDELPRVQRVLLRALYRVRPDGVLSPRTATVRQLCHDLDARTTETVLARRVPEAPRLLLEPVQHPPLPKHLPSHVVRLLDDRAQTDAERARSLARLSDVRVHDVDAGHLPMLSQPAVLADLLESIAREHDDPAPADAIR